MDKIIIFGTGSVAEELFSYLDKDKVRVVAFVNSYKPFETFHGIRVISENEISQMDFDFVVIGSGYVEKIKIILKNVGVPDKKIVAYIYDDVNTYKRAASELVIFFDREYNRSNLYRWIKSGINIPSIYPAVFWDGLSSIIHLEKDYVREQTVTLLARRIQEGNIEGSVAELGVYKGDFTVIISRLFSDRRLYLFDTFEGFSEKDVGLDQEINNKAGESQKFKDTSVEYVLDRIYNKNVVIKKGYFPETFDIGNENFCFVSIDLNLEKPVYDALELFYPRMATGGYILVSDYYAPFYKGSKNAVEEFHRKWDVQFTPLADFYGSVLFCKG